ncbi:SGNH/GDSL hydrolase family protein [Rhodococcus pyridinivorans]|uniref:SGNH/GDSL hydrolase family protein n=1 Tax=Rhodococcus pyridinivorans TaxID=103816 RepID=UPI003AAD3ED2
MTSPSQPRWPNPGPDGRLKPKHLPEYLSETDLNATYVRAVNGSAPDASGNVVVAGGGSSGLVDTSVMQTWYAALASRDYAQARIMYIGDSTGEGEGVTSISKRVVNRLQSILRQRFPVDGIGSGGGVGYLPVFYVSPSLPDPATTGSVTPLTSFGMGGRAYSLDTSKSVTFNITGTHARIFYVGGTSSGDLQYTLDGGTPASFPTVVTGATTDGKWYDLPLGASGPHTLVITRTATPASNAYLAGVWVFDNDVDKGIHVVDASHYGWKASDMATTQFQGYLQQQVAAVQPDAVIVSFGLNEQGGGVEPSVMKTNLQTIISRVKAGATVAPSIILLGKWDRSGSYTYPWADYVAAMREIDAADAGVTFVDMSTRIPKAGSTLANSLSLFADASHASERGQAMEADLLSAVFSPS